MIKKYLKKQTSRIAKTVATVFLLTSIVTPSPVMAGPGHGGHGGPGGGPFPMEFAQAIMLGTLTFFFLDGIFYKKKPDGYVITPAPIGARVAQLPPAVVMVNMNGRNVYTYSGVYYQQVPNGYMVIEQPNAAILQDIQQRQHLTVMVASLNVRSGPGKEYQVIQNVRQGELLAVEDVKSDWCLVKLPDGSYGWVMSQYTATIKTAPRG